MTKKQNHQIDKRIARHREKRNWQSGRDVMLGKTCRRKWGKGATK